MTVLTDRRLHPLSPLLDSMTMAARSWPALIALVVNGSLWQAPVVAGLAGLLVGGRHGSLGQDLLRRR